MTKSSTPVVAVCLGQVTMNVIPIHNSFIRVIVIVQSTQLPVTFSTL